MQSDFISTALSQLLPTQDTSEATLSQKGIIVQQAINGRGHVRVFHDMSNDVPSHIEAILARVVALQALKVTISELQLSGLHEGLHILPDCQEVVVSTPAPSLANEICKRPKRRTLK